MLTPDLAISGILSVTIITNVILVYRSADFKKNAPSFKNTIVIDQMNYYSLYTHDRFMTIVFLKEGV